MMGTTISWDAADYARNSTAQLGWARELLDKLSLGGDEALLDIGCGDGKVSADLSRRLCSGSVLGIDSSAQMVTLARQSFPVSEYSNLSFASADARWLDFEARFDVVFSSATLHWIRGHGPVLAGIERSLKVGGQFRPD